MDTQLLVICILTFVIHLIGTLAYAARIAGVRTRRIAISFSLFNILILVSRTSNSFQGPFLAKRIETTAGHPFRRERSATLEMAREIEFESDTPIFLVFCRPSERRRTLTNVSGIVGPLTIELTQKTPIFIGVAPIRVL
jgi:hypothetical protein